MTKHLGKGSTDEPLQEGKLRLYSMRFCPYAQRTHLILYAKNIPHDTVYINLKNKPEWYLEQYPLGKVPAIRIDGDSVYESLIICDFLDEKFPDNPMYPSDPIKKAKDRIVIEAFGKVISLLYQCYLSPTMDVNLLHPAFDAMDFFEKELINRGTPFFFGDKPGMVDYMIWPWCERLEMLKVIGGDNFKVPKDRFAKLLRWCEAMLEDEPVQKHYITPIQHANYLQSRKAGTPDYDNIL